MSEIITLIVVFAIGWFFGSRLQYILDRITFKSILDDLGVSNKQLRDLAEQGELTALNPSTPPEDELDRVEITLERDRGVIYAYRKDSGQFLAQGSDQDQLIAHLNLTFAQGARLIIREANGAELLQKNNG
jgi:hypothetical protein